MTKIEAIKRLMQDYNGVVNWEIVYKEIERYYPNAKKSVKWQEGLRGVLYRDLKINGLKRIGEGLFALNDYDEMNLLSNNKNDTIQTNREAIIKIRLVQSKFRNQLIKSLNICPITNISDSRLLIASHIKPWCFSTDSEKVDIYNGFLFSPTIDCLFDNGLITFTNKKELIFSPTLKEETAQKLNIKEGKYELLPIEKRQGYLEFHRKYVFKEY